MPIETWDKTRGTTAPPQKKKMFETAPHLHGKKYHKTLGAPNLDKSYTPSFEPPMIHGKLIANRLNLAKNKKYLKPPSRKQ